MRTLNRWLALAVLLLPAACGAPPADMPAGQDTAATRPDVPASEPAAVVPAPVGGASVAAEPARAVTNEDYLEAALAAIGAAQTELEIVQFEFVYGRTVGQLQRALGEAVQRGVKVSVLVDEEVERSAQAIGHLTRLGVTAQLDSPRKRTHVKLILADRRIALFGSTNWSDQSILRTNESNIRIDDPVLGAALHEYVRGLWQRPDDDAEPATATANGLILLFDRAYAGAAMKLLREAQSIDLQLYGVRYYPDDPASPSSALVGAVAAAARRGVKARAIIEESNFSEMTNRFNGEAAGIFAQAGVAVRRDPINRTSHSKMLLTDRAVIIGSTNWGYGAMRQYHELNVLIEDPGVADGFRRYFAELWRQAR